MMIHNRTFADISNDESVAARCLGLIERHAHRFMIAGGGGTSRECANNRRKITDFERAEIRKRLLETNGNHQAEIGHECGGISQTTVSKIWRQMCQA
jgi:hypothetical protein